MRRAAAISAALVALAWPAAGHAETCAPPSLTGGDWPMYGHDYSNTRDQSNEKVISAADVPTLTSAWVFSSVANGGAGDFTGTPVVADGCVYFASTRGWAFAVNADTGKLVWKTKVPYGGGVNSSVAVAERTLPSVRVKEKRRSHRRRNHRTRHHSTRSAH